MDVVTSVLASLDREPPRIKAIDTFMAFLVAAAGVQFAFCLLVGNFPFNAFLAGFSACVGQFVLLAALRIQIAPANRPRFREISPRRAFTHFVVCSLVLHLLVLHFIN